MPNLTEKAGGDTYDPSAVMARTHQAWEESMLRQLETLQTDAAREQPEELALRCGMRLAGEAFFFDYWNRPVRMEWPGLQAQYLDTGQSCSVFDLSLFLFYLKKADGIDLAGRWISLRELPGGAFYNQAFQGYSGDRLARELGEKPAVFHIAAKATGGWRLSSMAEHAYGFQALPRLGLAALLRPGDDEFPSRASILFDAHSGHYMTTDGLAILGSGLVSRLIKAAG